MEKLKDKVISLFPDENIDDILFNWYNKSINSSINVVIFYPIHT